MSKYHPKIIKLAEIMNVSPATVIMHPDSFEIIEIYDDELGAHHYKVTLTSGITIIEKTKKA